MLIQQKDTINFRFLPRTKASFTGGKVSSDSGLLLYKEFIEKMGINDIIADHLCFDDKNENRVHLMEDVLTQILYQKLAGYHSDLAATQLRNDPVFNTIQNNRALASQPTLSRFHTELTEEHLSNLRKINELILENAYKVENPTEMIYDLDSTFIKVYGNQEDSSYSGFYGDIGYHPLVLFDGITGDFLKCTLRPGHVYTKTGVVEFTEPVLRRHKEIYPDVNIITRGDSGFADPNLYCLLEDNDCEYVIRLKSNAVLVREGGNTEVKLFEEMNKEDDFYSYRCIYGEFYYKAASWRQSRRVIVRAEKKLGSLVVVLTFYVTNLTWSPKEIVKFYNKRGTMELFIKEAKNDFSFDNMNRKTFLSNKIALQISMIAYNINNLLRRLCFPEEKKKMRMKTIRAGIIKIGARQVQSGRYTTFKMSSHAVNQKLFSQIFENIAKMKKGLRPQVA